MSANRFDFQRDWALCRLFDLHEGEGDYALLMEHHDDVIILDSPEDPTAIDFYQLKTGKGHSTIDSLLKPKQLEDGKGNSILGKMIDNCLRFQAAARSVNLVCDRPYKVPLKCGTKSDAKDEICLAELTDDEAEKVVQKIAEEHDLADPPAFLELVRLLVTTLSVNDHADHAMGKLAAFMGRVRPGVPIAIPPLYNTLYGDLRRKANYEKTGLDFDGLLRLKGITRDQFAKMIAEVKEQKKFEREWPTINTLLASEGVGFVELIRICEACRLHEIERMNRDHVVLTELRTVIGELAQSILTSGDPAKLSEALALCVTHGRARRIKGSEIFTDPYLKAIGLFHLYGY